MSFSTRLYFTLSWTISFYVPILLMTPSKEIHNEASKGILRTYVVLQINTFEIEIMDGYQGRYAHNHSDIPCHLGDLVLKALVYGFE